MTYPIGPSPVPAGIGVGEESTSNFTNLEIASVNVDSDEPSVQGCGGACPGLIIAATGYRVISVRVSRRLNHRIPRNMAAMVSTNWKGERGGSCHRWV